MVAAARSDRHGASNRFNEIDMGGAEGINLSILPGSSQSNITTTVAMESAGVDRSGQ